MNLPKATEPIKKIKLRDILSINSHGDRVRVNDAYLNLGHTVIISLLEI